MWFALCLFYLLWLCWNIIDKSKNAILNVHSTQCTLTMTNEMWKKRKNSVSDSLLYWSECDRLELCLWAPRVYANNLNASLSIQNKSVVCCSFRVNLVIFFVYMTSLFRVIVFANEHYTYYCVDCLFEFY